MRNQARQLDENQDQTLREARRLEGQPPADPPRHRRSPAGPAGARTAGEEARAARSSGCGSTVQRGRGDRAAAGQEPLRHRPQGGRADDPRGAQAGRAAGRRRHSPRRRPSRPDAPARGSSSCARASSGPPGASSATRPPPCGGPRARSKTSPTRSIARSPRRPGEDPARTGTRRPATRPTQSERSGPSGRPDRPDPPGEQGRQGQQGRAAAGGQGQQPGQRGTAGDSQGSSRVSSPVSNEAQAGPARPGSRAARAAGPAGKDSKRQGSGPARRTGPASRDSRARAEGRAPGRSAAAARPGQDGRPARFAGRLREGIRAEAAGGRAPIGCSTGWRGEPNGPGGPITGEGFRQWSDRMRDVEELLDDPELRAEAARIRDRVRGAREEFKRHSKEPDWNQAARRSWPTRSASSATGSPRRSAAASRPTPSSRSIATRSRRNSPRASGGITNDWGAANDRALPDLGLAPLVGRRRRPAGGRGGPAPLELRPRAGRRPRCGSPARLLKALGFAALAISLLEPLLTGSRPRRGANAFVILADNSQSLLIRDDETTRTRGDWVRDRLRQGVRLEDAAGAGFRRPQLCLRLPPPRRRRVRRPDLRRHGHRRWRRRSRPSRSGSAACRWPASSCSPTAIGPTWATSTGRRCRRSIPSCPPSRGSPGTSACTHVSISQTNFESAPVVLRADVVGGRLRGRADRRRRDRRGRARTSSARRRRRPGTASR